MKLTRKFAQPVAVAGFALSIRGATAAHPPSNALHTRAAHSGSTNT